MVTCRKCFSEIGKGKTHRCSEAAGVKVLTERSLQLGSNFGKPESRSYQRVSTNLTKAAYEKENIPRGEAMKMATGDEIGILRERETE